MYEFSCKKAGAGACGFRASAGSEAELRNMIAEHARSKHRVPHLTDTIFSYMKACSSR